MTHLADNSILLFYLGFNLLFMDYHAMFFYESHFSSNFSK